MVLAIMALFSFVQPAEAGPAHAAGFFRCSLESAVVGQLQDRLEDLVDEVDEALDDGDLTRAGAAYLDALDAQEDLVLAKAALIRCLQDATSGHPGL